MGKEKPVQAAAFAAASKKTFTLGGIAAELGISLSTLKRRLSDNNGENELAEIRDGERGRKEDAAEAAIWRSALGDVAYAELIGVNLQTLIGKDEKPAKPQPISQIWLSKNVLGWKDKPDFDPEEMDDEDLERVAIEILQRAKGGAGNMPKAVQKRAKELADREDDE